MFQILYEYSDPWPEEGTLTFDTHLRGELKVSPKQAQRRANSFLTMDVGLLMGADDPILVWGKRPVWRFTTNMYLPDSGKIGEVGTIEVDAVTGQVVRPSKEQITSLQDRARDLTIRSTSSTATVS